MNIIGHKKPQVILATRVDCTSGGLTTWIEFYSTGGPKKGNVSLLQGDTDEILEMLRGLIKDIKKAQKAEAKGAYGYTEREVTK
jgi:hypothetical protein